VREVLKALGDTAGTGETRVMHAPPAPRAVPRADQSLSDSQVLKLLETRQREHSDRPIDVRHDGIVLLKPDDTGTRQALRDALANNAPVAFAVQLQWSVQPVELDKVPPLAIFSAYTLYTVEGSREGRKWYGLRLGFFSDAISAKQVAYYVRSEFASVAVVPVSPQEKARASDDHSKAAATIDSPIAERVDYSDEFKLIDDTGAARPPAVPVRAPPPAPKPEQKPLVPVPVPRTTRPAGKVGARERRGAHTFEETLEILGAGELTIDNGRGEIINASGLRNVRAQAQQQRNSPFAKLLVRLSERMKKP